MGCCLLAALVFAMPRLVMILLWLFQPLFYRAAYDGTWLVPLIGFFLLPWTTLAYAYAANGRLWPSPTGWLIVIVGLALDIITSGGGRNSYRRRS